MAFYKSPHDRFLLDEEEIEKVMNKFAAKFGDRISKRRLARFLSYGRGCANEDPLAPVVRSILGHHPKLGETELFDAIKKEVLPPYIDDINRVDPRTFSMLQSEVLNIARGAEVTALKFLTLVESCKFECRAGRWEAGSPESLKKLLEVAEALNLIIDVDQRSGQRRRVGATRIDHSR